MNEDLLANAIVEAAAKDYRRYRRRYYKLKKRIPEYDLQHSILVGQIVQIEDFFQSDWFSLLQPNMEGKYILDKLREEFYGYDIHK